MTKRTFKPTYLYIKTHIESGLKYFGMTTNKDPHKYKGSGKMWTNHIKAHGYNVVTEIYGYYINEAECKFAAVQFSIIHNIVESPFWANLKPEYGEDGGGHLTPHTPETKLKMKNHRNRKSGEIIRIHNGLINSTIRIEEEIPEGFTRGVNHMSSPGRSGDCNSQFGTVWITDGEKNTKVNKDYKIPAGWRKGRSKWVHSSE